MNSGNLPSTRRSTQVEQGNPEAGWSWLEESLKLVLVLSRRGRGKSRSRSLRCAALSWQKGEGKQGFQSPYPVLHAPARLRGCISPSQLAPPPPPRSRARVLLSHARGPIARPRAGAAGGGPDMRKEGNRWAGGVSMSMAMTSAMWCCSRHVKTGTEGMGGRRGSEDVRESRRARWSSHAQVIFGRTISIFNLFWRFFVLSSSPRSSIASTRAHPHPSGQRSFMGATRQTMSTDRDGMLMHKANDGNGDVDGAINVHDDTVTESEGAGRKEDRAAGSERDEIDGWICRIVDPSNDALAQVRGGNFGRVYRGREFSGEQCRLAPQIQLHPAQRGTIWISQTRSAAGLGESLEHRVDFVGAVAGGEVRAATEHRTSASGSPSENYTRRLGISQDERQVSSSSVIFWNTLSEHLGRQVFGISVFGHAGPEAPTVYAVLYGARYTNSVAKSQFSFITRINYSALTPRLCTSPVATSLATS
ncbi:hypothetical protein K438DRAFT_1938337 [Mycena galopus ATCC 62051]|nr:hypothetical protein K438DRAFT_1938337 [Mycena galopus ATCC 62051]